MKFLDIFGLILTTLLLLIIGMSIAQSQAWTEAMKGTAFWFTQALAYSLTIIAMTCAITGKKVRELSNTTIAWISVLVLAIALIGIGWANQTGDDKECLTQSIFQLAIFYVTLISLFLIPRCNSEK